MTSALSLLITAQMLLAAVLGNPALPEDFKANAIAIANNAIVVANEEIAKAQQPMQTAPQPTPQPVQVGAIIPSVTKELHIDVESYMENANGPYINIFVYYLEDGKEKSGVTVSASATAGEIASSKDTGPNGYRNGAPAAFFVYLPGDKLPHNVTFSVGDTSKTVSLRAR